jgi:branched-chain amino acid transport system ATP-binding protein
MLKVRNIDTYYGKVQALHDVSMEIGEDEIISIIGSNGAGKSTLMKTIMGIVKPRSGSIQFTGKELTQLKASRIVHEGIAYVPEGREVFAEMTIRDNLEMGAFSKKYSPKEMNQRIDEIYDIFPRLRERSRQLAGSLSGGEQQMLAVGRGLMSAPKLIMFDEPSLGLAPVIVEEVFKVIVSINKEKHIPVVLVEQNAYMALKISDRTYVLENGCVTLSGKSKDIMESDEVKKSYLGG